MPPKQKEKVEAEIRKLAKLEGNKTCADCTEKMPSYVNLTHKTFVCTKCSGIHRELQYKVKGISMSEFNQQEVTELTAGGNVLHNSKFLARHSAKDVSVPSGSDVPKLREFIRLKYVDKKWYSDDGRADQPSPVVEKVLSSSQAPTASTHAVVSKPVAKPVVSGGLDLLDLMDALPAPAPASAVQSTFDAFSTSVPTAVKPAAHSTFDAFAGSTAAPVNPTVFSDFFSNPTPPTTPATVAQQGQFSFSDFAAPAASSFLSAFPPTAPVASVPAASHINFIQLNPPSTPAAAAAPTTPAAPAVKNFSAFDDINPVAPPQHPSAAGPQINPFDSRARPPGNPFGQPSASPYQHGFPGQYAPQAVQYPYPAQPQSYPAQPQPQAFGVPPRGYPGYPPAQPPYAGQGFPQQAYPPASYPQPAAAAPTPDPFATVGGLQWGALTTGATAHAPSTVSTPAPAPAPSASTNPFDLF